MSPKLNTNGRVTLAILGTKIDNMADSFIELKTAFDTHIKEDRQTQLDVDRLKNIEDGRKWHFRTIWTAIVAIFASAIGVRIWGG